MRCCVVPFFYIYNSSCSCSTVLVAASQTPWMAASYVCVLWRHRLKALQQLQTSAHAISQRCLSTAFCLWLIHAEMNCYITPLSPPFPSFPLLPLLQQWMEECAQYGLRVTALQHASSSILSECPKAPRANKRSSAGCLLCIRFFPHTYTRDYILRGGAEWARWIVCAYLQTGGGGGGFFLTFLRDALPLWDCITFPFAPVLFFSSRYCISEGNTEFGLRMTWTETFHPRI